MFIANLDFLGVTPQKMNIAPEKMTISKGNTSSNYIY